MKLLSSFCILLILALKGLVSASDVEVIKGVCDAAICIAAGLVDPIAGIACSVYTGTSAFIFKENKIEGVLIEKGKCQYVQVCPNTQTEVCSDKPQRIYGESGTYNVRGCYNWGTPHKDFRECCRIEKIQTGQIPVCGSFLFCAGGGHGTKKIGDNVEWQYSKQCVKNKLKYYECVGKNKKKDKYKQVCDNDKVLYNDSCKSNWYP
jgi:hypothetical protein